MSEQQFELPLIEKIGKSLTVGQGLSVWWHLHFKHTRGAKPQRSNLKAIFKNKTLVAIPLQLLTGPDILDHRTRRQSGALTGRMCAPQTANKDHMMLSAMINWFYKRKQYRTYAGLDFSRLMLPVTNPCRDVKKADWKKFSTRRIVDNDERSLFMEHATDRIKDIFLMVEASALRKTDLENLRKTDLNRRTRIARIIQSKTGEVKEFYATDPIIRIFERAQGPYVLDFTNFRREWNAALKHGKVDRFTLCNIRKTSVTKVYEKTKDIKLAQEAAGHKDPAVTWTYIVRKKKELERIGRVLLC